jgi:hypothetical protein
MLLCEVDQPYTCLVFNNVCGGVDIFCTLTILGCIFLSSPTQLFSLKLSHHELQAVPQASFFVTELPLSFAVRETVEYLLAFMQAPETH